jgi:hypothetical protein
MAMNALTTTTAARIGPAAAMRRAWELFRRQYNFPRVPLKRTARSPSGVKTVPYRALTRHERCKCSLS